MHTRVVTFFMNETAKQQLNSTADNSKFKYINRLSRF